MFSCGHSGSDYERGVRPSFYSQYTTIVNADDWWKLRIFIPSKEEFAVSLDGRSAGSTIHYLLQGKCIEGKRVLL